MYVLDCRIYCHPCMIKSIYQEIISIEKIVCNPVSKKGAHYTCSARWRSTMISQDTEAATRKHGFQRKVKGIQGKQI